MAVMRGFRSDERAAGVILHPTSLPGPHGIGDLGPEAHRWVDLLGDTGTGLWQVLPLGPTGYADSPYACFSSFAGNVNLVSPDLLAEEGLIDHPERPGFPDGHVDYGPVIEWKHHLLTRAHERFLAGAGGTELRQAFEAFRVESESWLPDFCLFMALKGHHGGRSWVEWDPELRARDAGALRAAATAYAAAIEVAAFGQFLFYRQWRSLRAHAASRKVRIIGDVPFFVAGDSADVWSRQELFELRSDGNPRLVAGVPPDYFSDTGQLWGNPQYRWSAHRDEGYQWWADRLTAAFGLCDIVRIDHFRAFADYWEIPGDAPTAKVGRWRRGPGAAFFDIMRTKLGALPIIAEDLGDLSPLVPRLLDKVGFPGMAILQFAWYGGDDDPFLPHNYVHNLVAYTGTHDNDTTLGWWRWADEAERERARAYLGATDTDPVGAFLEALWASVAMFSIVPIQDMLRLGAEARMNEPGTTSGNWQWRALPGQIDDAVADDLADLNERHDRRSDRAADSVTAAGR